MRPLHAQANDSFSQKLIPVDLHNSQLNHLRRTGSIPDLVKKTKAHTVDIELENRLLRLRDLPPLNEAQQVMLLGHSSDLVSLLPDATNTSIEAIINKQAAIKETAVAQPALTRESALPAVSVVQGATPERLPSIVVSHEFYETAADIVRDFSTKMDEDEALTAQNQKKLEQRIEKENEYLKALRKIVEDESGLTHMKLTDLARNYLKGINFKLTSATEEEYRKLVYEIQDKVQLPINAEQYRLSKGNHHMPHLVLHTYKNAYEDIVKLLHDRGNKFTKNERIPGENKRIDQMEDKNAVQCFFEHYINEIDTYQELCHRAKKSAVSFSLFASKEKKARQQAEKNDWEAMARTFKYLKKETREIYNEAIVRHCKMHLHVHATKEYLAADRQRQEITLCKTQASALAIRNTAQGITENPLSIENLLARKRAELEDIQLQLKEIQLQKEITELEKQQLQYIPVSPQKCNARESEQQRNSTI